MAQYNQGAFEPRNPEKYTGTYPITYRSAWELTFMNLCDVHPNILNWASESIRIPYQHPLTTRWHQYIPDFYVVYMDKNGDVHGEVIEIKPLCQSLDEAVRNKRDAAALAINKAKWASAHVWCRQQGLKFRIMTEAQLYRQAGGK